MRAVYYRFATYIEKSLRIDAHYFLHGGFWLILTQAILVTSGVVTTALFAHFLSGTDYGIYRYLIGLAVILSSLSLTGLGEAILQSSAKKYYYFYNESLKSNLYYNTPMIFLSLGGGLYYWINQNNILSLGCLLIAILQPIINSFQFIPVFLQGSKRFQESTILQSTKTLFVAALTVSALLLEKNVLILFAVYLVANVLFNILSHLLYRPDRKEPASPEIIEKYLTYAKNTSVRNFVSTLAFRFDTLLIFTRLGALELAIFTIAVIIPEQIKGSFKNIASLLIPKYASHPDFNVLKKSIPKRSLQLFFILLLIAVLYILAAPYVYGLFFPKYQSAVIYSQLFALTFPAYVYYIPLTLLMAKMDEKKMYDFHIRTSVFQLFTVFLFIYFLGLLGAVLARIVVQYSRMAYCFWLVFSERSS